MILKSGVFHWLTDIGDKIQKNYSCQRVDFKLSCRIVSHVIWFQNVKCNNVTEISILEPNASGLPRGSLQRLHCVATVWPFTCDKGRSDCWRLTTKKPRAELLREKVARLPQMERFSRRWMAITWCKPGTENLIGLPWMWNMCGLPMQRRSLDADRKSVV